MECLGTKSKIIGGASINISVEEFEEIITYLVDNNIIEADLSKEQIRAVVQAYYEYVTKWIYFNI